MIKEEIMEMKTYQNIDLIIDFLNTKRFDIRRLTALMKRHKPNFNVELIDNFDVDQAKYFHGDYVKFFCRFVRGKVDYEILNFFTRLVFREGKTKYFEFEPLFVVGPPVLRPMLYSENFVDSLHQTFFMLMLNNFTFSLNSIRKCEFKKCGKFFRAKRKDARFCSDRCRYLFNYHIKGKAPGRTKKEPPEA